MRGCAENKNQVCTMNGFQVMGAKRPHPKNVFSLFVVRFQKFFLHWKSFENLNLKLIMNLFYVPPFKMGVVQGGLKLKMFQR